MSAKRKTNNRYERQLWDAVRVLCGHIPATEYRKVITGLAFLRYISAIFERKHQELAKRED